MYMKRTFRFSATTNRPLSANHQHMFAVQHALSIYRSNSIYSYIPKNACSTLRLSLAMDNGCIKDPSEFNWIHQNNQTFVADLRGLVSANYAFTILRCPFSRLASAYLEKFGSFTNDAWNFQALTEHRLQTDQVSFEVFVKELQNPEILHGNVHWKPQIHFLVYDAYDDVFAMEDFKSAAKRIRSKTGMEVVDARGLTNHGVSRFQQEHHIPSPERLTPFEIKQLNAKGLSPAPATLYTDELVAIVKSIYRNDLELYRGHFGSQNLLIQD